jgi:hypothetical protein
MSRRSSLAKVKTLSHRALQRVGEAAIHLLVGMAVRLLVAALLTTGVTARLTQAVAAAVHRIRAVAAIHRTAVGAKVRLTRGEVMADLLMEAALEAAPLIPARVAAIPTLVE